MAKAKGVEKKAISFVRTASKLKIGAHVPSEGAGAIGSRVVSANSIGANSFALFLKNPKRWVSAPYEAKDVAEFKRICLEMKYDPLTDVLPHGSYFINLANPDPVKVENSYNCLLDDLHRCEDLGIGLYNFHPGSDLGSDHTEALKRLATNLNRAISETKFVKVVIENMAGHGNFVGGTLEDLHEVIEQIDDKTRVGICVDTCHAFAAGYDLSDIKGFTEFWAKFDEIVGFKYLSALHLNDSKAPLGANRDLHERLGWGFLGLECFRLLVNDARFEGIPLILEVPFGKDVSIFGDEIKLLEWLVGRSGDDSEFVAKVVELQKLGAPNRKEQEAKFVKKVEKRKAGKDIASMLKKSKK
ncbi:unnamed protein product [Kuraishia capsulata CBS 1993]|uniref:Apurinic-apyrimidinic endonuclease 1 n=1 Tax=Kuraishia capsulata CBS 1993 TaxID=1382522 RepID=W6MJL5_9ASCO|nr:uncharacterized protein KUCA_T00000618001 [Kuraishia capsulata CBS 1993]CDK24652.1 unnamed protein product [Kuraishia capsulata CBS 1993]